MKPAMSVPQESLSIASPIAPLFNLGGIFLDHAFSIKLFVYTVVTSWDIFFKISIIISC